MTPSARRRRWPLLGAAALYALLLAYGTLFPLHWSGASISPWQAMLDNARRHTSWADLVTNLLVYIPLGLLLMWGLQRERGCKPCRWLGVVLLGGALSLALEYLQAFLPGRTPSLLDLTLNVAGTAIGATLAWLFHPGAPLTRHLLQLRQTHLRPGPVTDLGLAALGLWALAQLSPLVPSLDLDNLRQGIKPLWLTVQDPTRFSWLKAAAQACGLLALGLLYARMQRLRYGAASRFLSFAAVVLLAKIVVVKRQLSPEALTALLLSAGVLPLLLRRTLPAAVLPALLIAVLLLEALQPGTVGSTPATFNWIPFRGHLSNDLVGILDILGSLWPVVALAAAVAQGPMQLWKRRFLTGTVLLGAGLLALEWAQRHIPGRSPDITDVLVGLLAWGAAWFHLLRQRHGAPVTAAPAPAPPPVNRRRGWLAAGLAALALGGGVLLLPAPPATTPEPRGELPPPDAVPEPRLAHFRRDHPRLPAPSEADRMALEAANPGYLRQVLRRARGGAGALEAVILAERLDPGSQDLNRLFQRLMKLEPQWRGHQQAKPLALAYDWLYDRWTPAQRRALARKTVEAADYIIHFIRTEKLSPYNVYLYNSPLQGLMAAAIAARGDVEGSEAPFRWLAYYWKEKVLPVWRQVMGRNGGWHEGAEYVGIGIGQAVWALPAMWRRATGEDFIAREPGIRHFNDFLLFRTRPDGSHMRWGDGRFFDRRVPDAAPLAVETGHPSSLKPGCPRRLHPVGWPWGPLVGPEDCPPPPNPPLEWLFDGIGQLVARSGWSQDATWTSFKAGDNFWSHTHLDQGAFTLFKGRALAIDSGFYGPGYDSDHHMNYSYQTIAHNLVTVKDPDDRVPQPPKKRQDPPRPIANDGGQRRIGSGWGRRAPLDLEEWTREREIHHTATLARHFTGENLVVAVADLTPAYTNRLSGTGTFAHRTFRVRKYWRTFIYDRSEDLVIVHDDVVSADPEFRKRSLVHTLTRPEITSTGFRLEVPPDKRNPASGHLETFVLFPRHARIRAVGGPGQAFWVDGRNYAAGGKIWQMVARTPHYPPEPGRWRVEISPPQARAHDRFLMVLVPGERTLPPIVEPLEGPRHIGVRILGNRRTLTVRYPADRQGPRIEIEQDGERRVLDLTLPRAPLVNPPARSLWSRLLQWLHSR